MMLSLLEKIILVISGIGGKWSDLGYIFFFFLLLDLLFDERRNGITHRVYFAVKWMVLLICDRMDLE